jgi:hypothetical protein
MKLTCQFRRFLARTFRPVVMSVAVRIPTLAFVSVLQSGAVGGSVVGVVRPL